MRSFMRQAIHTDKAPAVIGNYSQAINAGNIVYLSGQIPLDPKTMLLISHDAKEQIDQVFKNIKNLAEAARGNLEKIVKLTVYLTDLSAMSMVNEAIAQYFKHPYPARTSIQVQALPKGASIEIDAIMDLL